MSNKQKIVVWVVLTAIVFSLFWWLCRLAMPEISLPFAIGITTIVVGGLFSGYHAFKIWFKELEQRHNTLVVILACGMLVSFVGIGILVNKMIAKTEFMEFSFTVLLLFFLNFCIGALVGLVRNRMKRRIETARRELAHSKSELQLLQSQLSPHFLFNTLNNVYGLSITNHEKVPALLLKLSELLRYTVYDAKELFVQLAHEVEYLKNYIDFEKIRLGNRLNLKLNFDGIRHESFEIPPMLLIIFVENAFKHSRETRGEQIMIDIALSNTEDEVVFSIKNSCFKMATDALPQEKHSGFGLESARKRLNLLYENRYTLTIKESENEYTVNLKLKR
ncbi:histidine kinase [Solitalea sp. MAHUQ-68]|uniref:Histidine kinase n=1 Tax=Solitalea agri TaxID=2953739 RepID=A0A9X2JDF1_9SPHI|nr:histidine kinase [Solitalea agri]MCO4293559.1 histidine kinase [Solitalea agri]